MFRWLAVSVVFVLCLLLVNDSASGAQKKKKGNISGAVVSIEPVKKDGKEVKDTFTLTVKTPEKKNKKTGTVTEAKVHTIEINADTKVEKAGKKKQPAEPATVADIQSGQNVTVAVSAEKTGVAEKVTIRAGKKKKTQ